VNVDERTSRVIAARALFEPSVSEVRARIATTKAESPERIVVFKVDGFAKCLFIEITL
jgi:hypothetical protein